MANGYEKYDSDKKDIEQLVATNDKRKRFTFITGKDLKNNER